MSYMLFFLDKQLAAVLSCMLQVSPDVPSSSTTWPSLWARWRVALRQWQASATCFKQRPVGPCRESTCPVCLVGSRHTENEINPKPHCGICILVLPFKGDWLQPFFCDSLPTGRCRVDQSSGKQEVWTVFGNHSGSGLHQSGSVSKLGAHTILGFPLVAL